MNLKFLSRKLVFITLLTMLVFLPVAQPALAGGVVGNGTIGSCTEAALDVALAGGGSITFNCGSSPVTITVTSPKTIAIDTSIDGGGKIALSGGNSTGVFYVNSSVTLALANLTVANGKNSGGAGVYNNGGILMVSDSTFLNNSASSNGGGIANEAGTLSITRSTFRGNSVTSNWGGAIYNSFGPATIANSTFYGNDAAAGAGAFFNYGGTVLITNSTFSGNSASGQGGGAMFLFCGAPVTLRNTIVANSVTGGNVGGCGVINGGNNIDDGTTAGWGSNNGSMSNTNPRLGSMADNGRPTYTMALLADSPALGAANPSYCPSTDQRGVIRPQPTGSICDIGAYESDLIHSYSISGRAINSSGYGISSMSISVGTGHTTTTDSSGNYTLNGLAAGTYTLTPSKIGYSFSPVSRTVTVPPDARGQVFAGTPPGVSSQPRLVVFEAFLRPT